MEKLHFYRDMIIVSLREYLKDRYSDIPSLAITMDCSNPFCDIVLYVHRTDNTWHTIALNITDKTITLRGRIVTDRWEGWRIQDDESQPLRTTTIREEINLMHRVRDLIASEESIPTYTISAYSLYPTLDNPFLTNGWYDKMELLGVGALPFTVKEHDEIDIRYVLMKIEEFIY